MQYRSLAGQFARVASRTHTQTQGETMADLIATESLVVFDDVLGFHRKLMAGQAVPPDLVDAYRAAVGDEAAAQTPGQAAGSAPSQPDYESQAADDLQAEAERRNLTVEGTGANGNVLKKDLIAALRASDSA